MGLAFLYMNRSRSLQFLMGQHAMAEQQQKLITKLMGFDFDIQYSLGCENKVADALSHIFHFMAFYVLHSTTVK